MKQILAINLRAFILFSISTFMFSCGGIKKAVYGKNEDVVEVKTPMSGSEYKSDNNYFRVVASGKSPDISFARKIAISNAQGEVARLIRSSISTLIKSYGEQSSDGENFNINLRTEEGTKIFADEVISNFTVKAEKLLKYPNKLHEQWICLEVSKKELKERVAGKLSQTNLLKIQANSEKFWNILDQEINKNEN
ncbi:MAG: hypothetical protein FJY17_01220 [Bacteroidetes bacterium]|nr:hypothetical protein [Bacteroidota bacterium]